MPTTTTGSSWWDDVKSWFSKIGAFMATFLKTEISDVVDQIGPIALDIVKQVQASGGTADEKFAMALSLMTAQLPNVAINAIRIAIETAVAVMNADASTTNSAAPDTSEAASSPA